MRREESICRPLPSTAQTLFKHRDGSRVIIHFLYVLALRALRSAGHSGRIMMSKLFSLLPVSGFITATEGAARVRHKKRTEGERPDSGLWDMLEISE